MPVPRLRVGAVRQRRRAAPKPDDWTIQNGYWTETAATYHESHVCIGDEHFRALDHVIAQCHSLGVKTVLDVGTGTGRGVALLRAADLHTTGVEPVLELLEEAVSASGLSRTALVRASGLALPFKDQSFDAVCATGVMHHIREPHLAIAEMTRVARRAVFISDSNRFGQGRPTERLLKLALFKTRLWNTFEWVRTGARRYHISEGDGLFYSYSVYDSLPALASWATDVALVATSGRTTRSHLQPLLTAPHVLLSASRSDTPDAPDHTAANEA